MPLEKQLKKTVKKIRNLDNLRLATLLTIPGAIAVLIYLILSGQFLMPEWLVDLIMAPAFVGNLLSGGNYLARALDALSEHKNQDNQPALHTIFGEVAASRNVGAGEKIGTSLGILAAVAVSVVLLEVAHTALRFINPLHYATATALFVISNVSLYSGIGNRLGSCADKKNRTRTEKILLSTAAAAGFAAGLSLVLTHSTALAVLAGVTGFATVATGGIALPIIMGTVFVLGMTGMALSATDYSIKGGRYLFSKDNAIKQKRFHEHRGAFAGVAAGLAIGLGIVAFIAATHGIGLLGLITAGIILTSCAGAGGSLCSRIGAFCDRWQAAPKPAGTPENSSEEEQKPPPAPEQKKTSVSSYFAALKKLFCGKKNNNISAGAILATKPDIAQTATLQGDNPPTIKSTGFNELNAAGSGRVLFYSGNSFYGFFSSARKALAGPVVTPKTIHAAGYYIR